MMGAKDFGATSAIETSALDTSSIFNLADTFSTYVSLFKTLSLAVGAPTRVPLHALIFQGIFAVLDHFRHLVLSAVCYADSVLHVLDGH